MAHKTIKAVIIDAMFSEAYVETPSGEQFLGSIELQIRDIASDDIYIKKLTEADLCEISGIDKAFSPLEIIKVAEHLRRFTQPIELDVDDRTHLISNAMIKGDTVTKEPPATTVRKNRPATKSNFGFSPEKAGEAMASRKRKPKPQA
jgi:hypothetical protein